LSIKRNTRYLQFAFNGSMQQVRRVLPSIQYDPRIIIEAGTPYIKQFGMPGVRLIRKLWKGMVVADLKVTDGAIEEVQFAARAGANAVTVMGSAPTETLDFFNEYSAKLGLYSMIDMLGVDNPLRKILPLKHKPNFVVIHKGRDEETNRRSIIRYRDISKIRSKYDVFISVAGGLDVANIRKVYFNGADVAILNIVTSTAPNTGVVDTTNFRQLIPKLLAEVGE